MSCIKVLFAGTGSALNPSRGQVSVLLDLGGELLVVDVGCSAPNYIARAGYDLNEISQFIVTHSHYDHLCGLPMVSFVRSFTARKAMRVIAPPAAVPDVEALLSSTAKAWRVEYVVRSLKTGDELRKADLKIRILEALHTVEAVGVMTEYKGIRVLVSGDTRPTESFRAAAQGAQLAIHEATLPSTMTAEALRTGHSTVREALQQTAGASLRVLYHISPESEEEAGKAVEALVPRDGDIIKIC
ncbi:MAG: MBL fold metallo-hydrolase [Acidilobaceae archaeon]|nr:MBL fold metallo-hydrolase [Acidilobaceae archaeon]